MRPGRESTAAARLAILAFHKIGPPPPGTWSTWNYIPAEGFSTYLEILAEDGWEVLDLAGLLAALEHPLDAPARAAVLSFDDGYRSMLTVAQPCLERFGFPALLFVPTAFVGGSNRFDEGAEPREPICSWEELRELQRRGVEIQSHGVTHRGFAGLSEEELRREAGASKAALEEQLERSVEILAYPYGDGGENPARTAALLQAAGYRAACLYKGGVQSLPAPEPFHLRRVAMGPDTDLRAALEVR